MSFRHRRAARELRGYIEGLYGPQPGLLVVDTSLGLASEQRVCLSVSSTVAPPPIRDPTQPPTHAEEQRDRSSVELVEELAGRLVSIRSLRYVPSGGLVPEDNHDAEYELHSNFPELFPLSTLELAVPWLELARAGAEALRSRRLLDGLNSSQVKSKFASLRWYLEARPGGLTREINGIIRSLELLSTVVCETCGAPGRHRKGGWHVIRCDCCQDVVDKERRKRGGGG